MQLRLKKKPRSPAVITAIRRDGSTTSGQLGTGDFGAWHDLAHYAVETTLGLRSGFLGLLEQGWNFGDFTAPGAAAGFPDEAIAAECIVGQLTNLVLSGPEVDCDDFNWLVGLAVGGVRPQAVAPVLDKKQFHALRECYEGLLARWRALPDGEALQLTWPA